MNIERRKFIRNCSFILLAGGTLPFLDGCTAAQVEADVQTVLNDLPTAINIAESIAQIVAAFGGSPTVNASTVQSISDVAGQVSSDLSLAESIIKQYETNLQSAPATILGELDSAVADANQNIQNILNAIHVYDSKTQAAISAAVASVDVVLLGLESLLPASSAGKFPRVAQALTARHIGRLGALQRPAVPKPHDMAASYNQKIAADFPHAVVPVPRAHWYSR